MPIYEFQCKDCSKEFKTLRRTDQLSDVRCPTCGTPRVIRLLSVTARSLTDDTAGAACALPAMGGRCMGNPAACGCND
jgi:putative FmdB family regulatory protein